MENILIFKTDNMGLEKIKMKIFIFRCSSIGDSFTMSNCINKPYDLKSQLEIVNSCIIFKFRHTRNSTWQQLAIAKKILNDTDFKKLVWIFMK